MSMNVTAAAADYRAESARDLAASVLAEFRAARAAQGDRAAIAAAARNAADHLDDLRVLCAEMQEMQDAAPNPEVGRAVAGFLRAALESHTRASRVNHRIAALSSSVNRHPAGRQL